MVYYKDVCNIVGVVRYETEENQGQPFGSYGTPRAPKADVIYVGNIFPERGRAPDSDKVKAAAATGVGAAAGAGRRRAH